MSDDHSCSDRIFHRLHCSLDIGGGGTVLDLQGPLMPLWFFSFEPKWMQEPEANIPLPQNEFFDLPFLSAFYAPWALCAWWQHSIRCRDGYYIGMARSLPLSTLPDVVRGISVILYITSLRYTPAIQAPKARDPLFRDLKAAKYASIPPTDKISLLGGGQWNRFSRPEDKMS